jgi:hypothetical protein
MGNEFCDLSLQFHLASDRLLMTVDIALERNLLRYVRELPVGQPHAMPIRPRLCRVPEATLQQEQLYLGACLSNVTGCNATCPHKIAHRLMHCIWNPDECQLSGTEKAG